MGNNLLEEIEAEYDAYCANREKKLDNMYAKLSQYLKGMVAMMIREGSYVDVDMAEELTQEVLITIATDKIHTFEKKDAKFTTFCITIAKNKALDYVRKRNRHRMTSYEEMEEEGFELAGHELYRNPERLLLMQERKLRQIEAVKKYLYLLMHQKGKPYRTVGCCYTMVLFHRYHPDTKELSSPGWAYAEIKADTIEDSSSRFAREINEWFPRFGLYWGDAFLDGMDEKEEDTYISDMVFGEHFKTKDLENWSLRMRNKIRQELLKQACELL